MNNTFPDKPVVLVFAGHDPSGGAGIQADIESIACAGCHAATALTILTQQNTRGVVGYTAQRVEDFEKQARLILDDMNIGAIKIGVIGDKKLLGVIVGLLKELPNIPVVLDPVINSESGCNFTDEVLARGIIEELFPLATIATPNSHEARILSKPEYTLDEAAKILLTYGCHNILITGTHESTDMVINTLYATDGSKTNFEYKRLTGHYHGSGCTLSSSIAAYLAKGFAIKDAVNKALTYTWESLQHGSSYDRGQYIPDRISWRLKDT